MQTTSTPAGCRHAEGVEDAMVKELDRAWAEAKPSSGEVDGGLVSPSPMVVGLARRADPAGVVEYLIDDADPRPARAAVAVGRLATLVRPPPRSRCSSWALAQGDRKMRKRLHAHVLRLLTSYFDSTKTYELIARDE
jgi:hypothetical protein